jgi:hypothetical protein
VNPSGLRALAMSWTVAVGVVLTGAVGIGPSAADDDPGGTAERSADGTVAAGNPGPRRVERTSRDPRVATRGSWQRRDLTEGAIPDDIDPGHPDVDCHWPDWGPGFTPSAGIGVGGGGGRGLILAAPAVGAAILIATPPVSGSATARTLNGLTPVESDGAGPAAPLTAPLGGPPAPPPAPPGPAVQAPPPPAVPPISPVPATVEPQPAAAQANPIRLGYPAYLQSASIAEITALAILGSAGLVALTGVGGFVGYRQAKTGSALRAAGTARFLP